MLLVFAVFYIVASVISFYAYREFKGMMFDNGLITPGGINNLLGGPGSMGGMMGGGGGGGMMN